MIPAGAIPITLLRGVPPGGEMTRFVILPYVCCTDFGGGEENVVMASSGGEEANLRDGRVIKGLAETVKIRGSGVGGKW